MAEEDLKERYEVEETEGIPERPIEENLEEEVELPKEEEKKEISLPELVLRIERLEGRLDMLDNFSKDVQERFLQLSQDIGELRSMIFERDKTLGRLESDIGRLTEGLAFADPERMKEWMNKKEKEIEEVRASLERLLEVVNTLRSQVKEVEELVTKIKDFESLVKLSTKLTEKISKLEDTEKYVTKLTGKVESIFMEMSDKLAEISTQKEKVDKLDELMVEVVKSLDEVSSKIVDFVKREDIEKIIEKKVEKIVEKQMKEKIEIVKGASDEIKQMKEKLLKALESTYLQLQGLGKILRTKEKELEMNIRFIVLAESLVVSKEPSEIKERLERFRNLIEEMKKSGIWDKDKEAIASKVINITVENFR